MSAALKSVNPALDILFGKRLNPMYVAWRERVARIPNESSFRMTNCDVCSEVLSAYYACPKSGCHWREAVLCEKHMDEHYAVVHNPETHAMEP